ncbi:MAG: type IV secretion system protein [Betaproteobacteria bacterium]|nr:type IV secretion system protein [Betaproteobacteria bacterium]
MSKTAIESTGNARRKAPGLGWTVGLDLQWIWGMRHVRRDDRYGDQIACAKSWRIAAVAALAVATVAVAGVAHIGAQSKIKPFVVAIDRMGSPIAVAQPSDGSGVTQHIIEAQLANWIVNTRTVLPDQTAQQTLLSRSYAMLSSNAGQHGERLVQGQQPVRHGLHRQPTSQQRAADGANTYQVNWTEVKAVPGQNSTTTHWKAQITVGVDAKLADKPQVMLDNPLGIFIQSLNWTQSVS